MKKSKLVFLTAAYLLILALVAAVISARSLKFNSAFFTPEYQAKYAIPEAAFEGMWKSLIDGDRKLYEEVLGRDSPGVVMSPSPQMAKPVIEKVIIRENSASILATSWGGSFEKVGGRWVFQNKEFGFFCREFFRLIGIELARFQ